MNSTQKFQNLLKDLFQFEVSDLDFGIYRILNYKREQIEEFINTDLKDQIEEAFSKHKDERLQDIDQKLKDYFIHKNLKSFLSNQLDYFIKAEVLSILGKHTIEPRYTEPEFKTLMG